MRDNPTVKEKKNFYGSFKSWIIMTYSSGEPTQEEWEAIMEQDSLNNRGDEGRDQELVEDDVGVDLELESDACSSFIYNIS